MHTTLLLALSAFPLVGVAQGMPQPQDPWQAPAEAATTPNPVAVSAESIRAGRTAYEKTCASCHGQRGAGDGFASRMLKQKPADLAVVLAGQSDGELFWKIRTGRGSMPSMSRALPERQTWDVVNYIRTFQPAAKAPAPLGHPWASFAEGAWVEVRTEQEMETAGEPETTSWSLNSRLTVGTTTADSVTVLHANPAKEIKEKASLVIPTPEVFPGVRAPGQWFHDIFPFGSEREYGMTPRDKQPVPRDVKMKGLRAETVEFDGKSHPAQVIERRWRAGPGRTAKRHVLVAWIVEGFELPVKWTLAIDSKTVSQSELVALSEPVQVGQSSVACVVTMTTQNLPDGLFVEHRWSSRQVPGFMVKMESKMHGEEYTVTVKEWVTDFQSGGSTPTRKVQPK